MDDITIDFIEENFSVNFTEETFSIEYEAEQWPAGIPGIPGIPGKSSYDIYVENGGLLTEQEWIDTFVDTYSKTELDALLDANFNSFYTKEEIDNKIIDWGQF